MSFRFSSVLHVVDTVEMLMAAVLPGFTCEAPHKLRLEKGAEAGLSSDLHLKQRCSEVTNDFSNLDNLK